MTEYDSLTFVFINFHFSKMMSQNSVAYIGNGYSRRAHDVGVHLCLLSFLHLPPVFELNTLSQFHHPTIPLKGNS